jgi:ATP-binding cassette subfamily B protein
VQLAVPREGARLIHDVALWVLAAVILCWTLRLWSLGAASARSVVLVASLTLRILHYSRDMALSLVDAAQHFGFIDETLAGIARPVHGAGRPRRDVTRRADRSS